MLYPFLIFQYLLHSLVELFSIQSPYFDCLVYVSVMYCIVFLISDSVSIIGFLILNLVQQFVYYAQVHYTHLPVLKIAFRIYGKLTMTDRPTLINSISNHPIQHEDTTLKSMIYRIINTQFHKMTTTMNIVSLIHLLHKIRKQTHTGKRKTNHK